MTPVEAAEEIMSGIPAGSLTKALARIRLVAAALIERSARKDAEIAASESEVMKRLFDSRGVECGNCGTRLIAQGGSLGEHHGLSSTENGDLAICGHCMGLEAADMQFQLAEPSENQALRAEVAELTGKCAHLHNQITLSIVSIGIAAESRDTLKHSERALRAEVERLDGVLGVIERICGDDFCEDLDMQEAFHSEDLTAEMKTAHAKLSAVYRASHSAVKTHSCFNVHGDWRAEVIAALSPAAQPLCQICVDADRVNPSFGFKRDVSGIPLCRECYADVAASMPAAQPAKEEK